MRALLAIFCLLTGLRADAGEIKTEARAYRGVSYQILRIEPDRLGLAWKGPDGVVLRSFERVRQERAKSGARTRFLMNAGIFEPGGIPSGLHVEDGQVLRPLNRKNGKGNFFLQPNGVFGVTKAGQARVLPTGRTEPEAFRLAVQSGPLLLSGGQRHPAFRANSTSRKHRNGVGVDGEGRVVLAITDPGQVVNFWDFAGLFLDLGCRDALFLDGDISQFAVDPKPGVRSNLFGAVLVVTEPAE